MRNGLGVISGSRRRSVQVDPADTSPGLWLRADSDRLFDSDVGGATPANGGSVGRWEDRSGNGRHYIQSNASQRPTRQVAGYNGRDFVRCDQAWLTSSIGLSLFSSVSAATIMMMYRWRTSPTTFRHAMFWSGANAVDSTRISLGGGLTSGNLYIYARRIDGGADARLDHPITAGAFMLQTGVVDYSTTSAQLHTDGILRASSSSFLTAGTTAAAASLRSSIGSHNGSTFCDIDVAEVLAWPRVLSSAELAGVHAHLAAYYASPS